MKMMPSNQEIKVSVISTSFLKAIRQALLMMVDAIERELQEFPTTATIRAKWKEANNKMKQKT